MSENPFLQDVQAGASADSARQAEAARGQQLWEAHVDACESIVRHCILKRLELAAEAIRELGNEACVDGVSRTETFSGTLHLKAELTLTFAAGVSSIRFIASPKSMVIASEGARGTISKRWKRIALTADAIQHHADEIIRDFLAWAVRA